MRSLLTPPPSDPSVAPSVIGLHGLTVLMLALYMAFGQVLQGGWSGINMALVLLGYSLTTHSIRNAGRLVVQSAIRNAWILFGVTALALLLGAIWMLPPEFAVLGIQVATGTGLMQNLLSPATSDMPATALGVMPMGTLWPIAVAGQYAVLWWLMHRWLLRHAPSHQWQPGAALIVTLLIASLAAAFWQPTSLGLHTRAWECLLGSLLAWVQQHRRPQDTLTRSAPSWFADALAAVGLLLVYLSVWQTAPDTASGTQPVTVRLLPVLGVAALLAAHPHTLVHRHLLALRPFVWLGQWSVPWYLCCAVLLGMAHTIALDNTPPHAWGRALLLALALLLAILATQALHHGLQRSRQAIAQQAMRVGLALVGAIVAGLLVYQLQGIPARFSALALDTEYQQWPSSHDAACLAIAPQGTPYDFCQWAPATQASTAPEVVLIGDSHANQYAPGLAAHKLGTMHLGMHGCPPFLDAGTQAEGSPGCVAESTNRAMALAIAQPEVHTIVLAGALQTYFAEPDHAQAPTLFTNDGRGQRLTGNAEVFVRTLDRTLQALMTSGKQVIIVLEAPRLPFDPSECIPALRGGPPRETPVRSPCSADQAPLENAQAPARQTVLEVAGSYANVKVLDPFATLCDGMQCHAARDGRLLYRDAQHLSIAGSQLMAASLAALLPTQPVQPETPVTPVTPVTPQSESQP